MAAFDFRKSIADLLHGIRPTYAGGAGAWRVENDGVMRLQAGGAARIWHDPAGRANDVINSITPTTAGGGWSTDGLATLTASTTKFGHKGHPLGFLACGTNRYAYQNGLTVIAGRPVTTYYDVCGGDAVDRTVFLELSDGISAQVHNVVFNVDTGGYNVLAGVGVVVDPENYGNRNGSTLWRVRIDSTPATTSSVAYVAIVNGAVELGKGHYFGCVQFPSAGEYIPTTTTRVRVHDALGVIVEEASTNLITNPRTLNAGATWAGSSPIVANQVTAPNDAVEMDKIREGAGLDAWTKFEQPAVANGSYNRSVWVKRGECHVVQLMQYDGVTNKAAWFNLNSGALAAAPEAGIVNARIEHYGYSDSYRISHGYTMAPGNTIERCQIGLTENGAPAVGNYYYVGDGVSGAYAWGAKLEAGLFATTYNEGTRTAETLTINPADIPGWNPDVYAFLIEVYEPHSIPGAYPMYLSVHTAGLNLININKQPGGAVSFEAYNGVSGPAQQVAGVAVGTKTRYAVCLNRATGIFRWAAKGRGAGTLAGANGIAAPDTISIMSQYGGNQGNTIMSQLIIVAADLTQQQLSAWCEEG